MEDGYNQRALIPPTPERPDVPGVTWRWWEAIVIFLIASIVGGVIALPIVAAVSSDKLSELVLAICGEIGLGGTTLVWLLLLHRRSMAAIGVPDDVGREVGVGIAAGVALYLLGVFVIGVIVSIILRALSDHHVHSPHQLPTHLSGGQIVLAGITVIVAAPIAEELFFRGFLFKSLRARRSFLHAGVISALCFGAVHFQGGRWQNALLLPIVMTFVGFGLAWLYERRGNIVANMAAHATFNVIGFLFIVSLNR